MPAPAPSSPAPFARVQDWFRGHRGLVDAVLALVLWVFLTFVTAVSSLDGREAAWLVVVSTIQLGPLAWRRTRPDVSFGIIAAGHLLQLLVASDPLPSNISALMSAYAVAAYSRHRRVRQVALVAATVAGPLAIIDWDGYEDTPLTALVFSALMYSGLALVCWLWGDLTRKRRELVSRLQEQNDALRRDRDQRARLAAQDERTRIAREMHDIVAHSLSVVVVQADGAAYTANHSVDFDREHAHRALTTIGTTAREALAETRRLVGVLRTAEDEGGDPTDLVYTPTETLADLPDLVDRIAATGIDVTLDQRVDPSAVPRETGLAAYRIVQESLTNVIKHAGPRPRVRVLVEAGPQLRVEVRDDGRGAAADDDGNGHGIIGMRERAASVGGTMTAGPARGGGYVVAATLPFDHEVAR
ncbi:MAG: sensor histidine kinase [Janibacter sp.]|nr:sensor histidine kinase [Janibacter sp.]